MPFEILLISVLRGLAEVAGLMLLGRGLLWLFGPKARQGNFVYDILTIGTKPFIHEEERRRRYVRVARAAVRVNCHYCSSSATYVSGWDRRR